MIDYVFFLEYNQVEIYKYRNYRYQRQIEAALIKCDYVHFH